MPSYLVAPLALLAYGDTLIDGLHQRLGDIRGQKASGELAGELFARYIGGEYRYASNRTFREYGFDFDQQNHALQVGGGVLALAGESSTLRAGWALDHGTTRVTPRAIDGDGRAKYVANGASAWITWQGDSGLYVDGVVGGRRYVGDVSTSLRGSSVARIHATAAYVSVEAGYPIALSPDWTIEPQVQVNHQSLTFDGFRDADQLDVTLAATGQTTSRLGAMVRRVTDATFMPYGRLDLVHTHGSATTVDASSEAFGVASRFGTARAGHAFKGSVGAMSQLTPRVQVYGEGSYQKQVGSYGMRGYAANLGVRVTF